MFKPTYLYVKTHNVTGLKYFGKTTQLDPHKYKGSGLVWSRHIKKHGYDVTTNIIGYFQDEQECRFTAHEFCKDNNIVASNEWANIKSETLDGGFDHIHSKGLSSAYMKQRWLNLEYREQMSQLSKDVWTPARHQKMKEDRQRYWTPEQREIMSQKMKGNQNAKNNSTVKYRFVTNELQERRIPESELNTFLSENPLWRRGVKKKKYPSMRKSRIKHSS